MWSYTVKENHMCSAVSKNLQYRQTNTHTNILLLYFKDTRICVHLLVSWPERYWLFLDLIYIYILGSVSTCWSPGQRDTDCPGNGLCCFDGCANTCDGQPIGKLFETNLYSIISFHFFLCTKKCTFFTLNFFSCCSKNSCHWLNAFARSILLWW